MDPNSSSTDSPPLRSTILNSFLGRGRPRNSSQSNTNAPAVVAVDTLAREMSTSPQPPQQRRLPGAAAAAGASPSTNNGNSPNPDAIAVSQSVPGSGLGFSMLRRRRSAGTVAQPQGVPAPRPASASRPSVVAANAANPFVTNNHAHHAPPAQGTHRIRLVPHLENRRSLKFDPITRDLMPGSLPLRIGRFTDRNGLGVNAVNALGSNKLAFKSKVVSRAHAEIWAESIPGTSNVKFLIKDTKSSSGTFLNHLRLSLAAVESKPHQIRDGDIVQLGVDYQGGAEDVYKSVKMRVEIGREWQSGANKFNTNAIKNLKSLAQTVGSPTAAANGNSKQASSKSILPDCCICLFPISIRQALFITPCSHSFHYKCIRPLVEKHFPGFNCPLCRTFADLEEDVEVEAEEEDEELDEALLLGLIDDGGIGGGGGGGGGSNVALGIEVVTPSEEDGPSSGASAAAAAAMDGGEIDSEVEVVDATTVRQVQARSRARVMREAQAQDVAGAETDVEPQQNLGGGSSGEVGGGSGSRRARGRGHGHARNLSSQMDPMELIRDRDEEEEGERVEDEVIDVDMLDPAVGPMDAMDQDLDQDQEVIEMADAEDEGSEERGEFIHEHGHGNHGVGQVNSEAGVTGAKRKR